MKIALIGYGAMGRMVESLATDSGDEIVLRVQSNNADELSLQLRGCDAAIDFSRAEAVLSNVAACAQAGVPLVEGTTGWLSRLEEARQIVAEHDAAFVYGANFSTGVNLFYRVVAHAAEIFAAVEGYQPFIEEAHHSRKKDAPSGTALKLQDIVKRRFKRDFTVASTRAGHIPGTHRVGFDSAADQILLTHEARSREGFAAGALLAARWLAGRKGFYEFPDVIDDILRP
jgi:4-hydroxy-tetrahydrodipicolinate reductase